MKKNKKFSASALINIHREGMLLIPTMRSLIKAKSALESIGGQIEFIVVADNIDLKTENAIAKFEQDIAQFHCVNFNDIGRSREFGIQCALNDYVFIHDGDDLYSQNWYASFFQMRKEDKVKSDRVYHTEYFLSFGENFFMRRMLPSKSKLFDPLFLITEWYYANKAVVHKGLYEKYPMPYYDKIKGLGSEDWLWNCHTIAGGIVHDVIPKTICFYRDKPVQTSLGKTPGVIHDSSPLFNPSSSECQLKNTPLSNNQALASPYTHLPIKKYPDEFLLNEIKQQQEFEPEISGFWAMEPMELNYPPIQYNIANAYREIIKYFDDRKKIFLNIPKDALQGSDFLIPQLTCALRKNFNNHYQVICLVEGSDYRFCPDTFFKLHKVPLVEMDSIKTFFSIGDWYEERFFARLFVQFASSVIIDLGTSFFAKTFTVFNRAILSKVEKIIIGLLDFEFDIASLSKNNLSTVISSHRSHLNEGPVAFCVSKLTKQYLLNSGAKVYRLNARQRHALGALRLRRYADQKKLNRYEKKLKFGETILKLMDAENLTQHIADNSEFEEKNETAYSNPLIYGTSTKEIITRTTSAWISPKASLTAQHLFVDNLALNILMPQIIFWHTSDNKSHCWWIANDDLIGSLGQLADYLLTTTQTIPFVLYTRTPISAELPIFLDNFRHLTSEDLINVIEYLSSFPPEQIGICGMTVCFGENL